MKMSQNNPDKDDQTSSNKKTISLPISRVRLIMKSSPDVSSINQDALFLTTKATVSRTSLIYHRLIYLLQLTGISSVSFWGHCKRSCSGVWLRFHRCCLLSCRWRSCLSSTWLCLRSTTAPGRKLTPYPTATWLTPQRRPRPSTSSQVRPRHRLAHLQGRTGPSPLKHHCNLEPLWTSLTQLWFLVTGLYTVWSSSSGDADINART